MRALCEATGGDHTQGRSQGLIDFLASKYLIKADRAGGQGSTNNHPADRGNINDNPTQS
jgi:hypothetical protein